MLLTVVNVIRDKSKYGIKEEETVPGRTKENLEANAAAVFEVSKLYCLILIASPKKGPKEGGKEGGDRI